jgi:hypothetical protein
MSSSNHVNDPQNLSIEVMLEAKLQKMNGQLQEARHNITLNLYAGRIVDLPMY